jgi:hypothetical protein
MYEQFSKGGWAANDESEDTPDKPVFDNSRTGKDMKDDIPF